MLLVVLVQVLAGIPDCLGAGPDDDELFRRFPQERFEALKTSLEVILRPPEPLFEWRKTCEELSRRIRTEKASPAISALRQHLEDLEQQVECGCEQLSAFSEWLKKECQSPANRTVLSSFVQKLATDLRLLWRENTGALKILYPALAPAPTPVNAPHCCPDAYEASGKREGFLASRDRLLRLFRQLEKGFRENGRSGENRENQKSPEKPHPHGNETP
jgi:hypothetical protein